MIEFTGITVQETVDVFGTDEQVTNIISNITVSDDNLDTACEQAARQVYERNTHRRIHSVYIGSYKDSGHGYYCGWKNLNRSFEKGIMRL